MAVVGTPKRMYRGQPAATDAVAYTAPSATPGAIIKQVTIVNTDTAARTVSIGINGTALTAANNDIANAMSINPNQTVTIDLAYVLNSADTIHVVASVASVINVSIHGLE